MQESKRAASELGLEIKYLLSLDWRYKILVLAVNTSADTVEVFSDLLRKTESLGMFSIQVGHQSTEWTLVFADEAGITLHHAVPTEPSGVLIGVNNGLMVHVVEGLLAAIAADQVAVATTERAEIIVLLLD